MTIFGFLLIYSLAIYGAWNVGCKVRDWLYGDDKADVTRLDSCAVEAPKTTSSSYPYQVPPLRADYSAIKVKARRQPRKASPATPSGKTARKRSTKSGK